MIDPHGEPVRENYRKQGELRERERIIELLQKQLIAEQKSYRQRTWIIQGFDYNNKPVIRQGNVTLIRYQ